MSISDSFFDKSAYAIPVDKLPSNSHIPTDFIFLFIIHAYIRLKFAIDDSSVNLRPF